MNKLTTVLLSTSTIFIAACGSGGSSSGGDSGAAEVHGNIYLNNNLWALVRSDAPRNQYGYEATNDSGVVAYLDADTSLYKTDDGSSHTCVPRTDSAFSENGRLIGNCDVTISSKSTGGGTDTDGGSGGGSTGGGTTNDGLPDYPDLEDIEIPEDGDQDGHIEIPDPDAPTTLS